MLIWRGKGILVFLITVLGLVIGNLLLTFSSSRGWVGLTPQKMPPFAVGLGLLIAATCNFYFARYLDDSSKHEFLSIRGPIRPTSSGTIRASCSFPCATGPTSWRRSVSCCLRSPSS